VVEGESIDVAVAGSDSAAVADDSLKPAESLLEEHYSKPESASSTTDKGVAATAAADATKANALGTHAAPDSTDQVDPDRLAKFGAVRAVGEDTVTKALAPSVAPDHNDQDKYMDVGDPVLAAWAKFEPPI
jgi:hypothetical protein